MSDEIHIPNDGEIARIPLVFANAHTVAVEPTAATTRMDASPSRAASSAQDRGRRGLTAGCGGELDPILSTIAEAHRQILAAASRAALRLLRDLSKAEAFAAAEQALRAAIKAAVAALADLAAIARSREALASLKRLPVDLRPAAARPGAPRVVEQGGPA